MQSAASGRVLTCADVTALARLCEDTIVVAAGSCDGAAQRGDVSIQGARAAKAAHDPPHTYASAVAKLEQIQWGAQFHNTEKTCFIYLCCWCIKLNFEGAYIVKISHLLVIFKIVWVHLHPPEYM
jgi:hypothetical protein